MSIWKKNFCSRFLRLIWILGRHFGEGSVVDNRCLAVAGDWENSDKKRRSTDFKIVCVALKYTLSRGYTGDLLPARV